MTGVSVSTVSRVLNQKNKSCASEQVKEKIWQAAGEIGMVVEGISTAEAAHQLADRLNVEMPITDCIYKMIQGEIDALEAVNMLMGRKTKNEMHI